MRITRANFKRL